MVKRISFHSFHLPGAVRLLVLRLCLLLLASTAVLSPAIAAGSFNNAIVVKVHDGDTVSLKMDGKVCRTRLIGFDAPEMGQEPWGKKAREHLRELLKEYNYRVLVETDVVKIDKYDRPLVYLWTPDRSGMINEQMLRDGYAVLFTIQPNSKHVDRFRDAQRSAKKDRVGIWGTNGLKERPRDYKKKHPREHR